MKSSTWEGSDNELSEFDFLNIFTNGRNTN